MWFSSPVSFASVSYFLDGVHISRLGRLFRSVARDTQTRAFIELNRNTKRVQRVGNGMPRRTRAPEASSSPPATFPPPTYRTLSTAAAAEDDNDTDVRDYVENMRCMAGQRGPTG